MNFEDEVKTTFTMLKNAGFKVAEIIFEGGVSVKDTKALAQLQQWSDAGKAYGVVHVVYFTADGQQRVIDINAGKEPEGGEGEAAGGEGEGEAPSLG
jgi:hypothetical protein